MKIPKVMKNVFANYLGQFWVVLMGIIFLPVYIHLLGKELFGLIGFYILLQSIIKIFDFGITPALSREMARFISGRIPETNILNLLRTIEILFLGISSLIMLTGLTFANLIANSWLKSEMTSIETLTLTVKLIAIVISLRFIEGVYRSCLIGLQEHVTFNLINSLFSSMRWAGSVAVLLFIDKSIVVFFVWHAVVSILALLSLRYVTYRRVQTEIYYPKFSINELFKIYKFAGGVFLIAVVSVLLTQSDKIIVSRSVDLSDFAGYSLMGTISGGILMLMTPMVTSIYPRFCELYAAHKYTEFIAVFHKTAFFSASVIAAVGSIIIFNADQVIFLWTRDLELANDFRSVLSMLALASTVNTFSQLPYRALLAAGNTKIPLIINTTCLTLFLIAAIIFIPKYGMFGAAFLWATLNVLYFIIASNFMIIGVLKTEKYTWLQNDILLPIVIFFSLNYVFRIVINYDELPISTPTWYYFSINLILNFGMLALLRSDSFDKIKKLCLKY